MKFDHIIMNPPYCRNLHLKILNEAVNHSDDIVNLSPIRWLQDPLAEHKKNSDWKKFDNVRNHIESIEVIQMTKSAALFNIRLNTDLGIYHVCNSEKHYDDLRDRSQLKFTKAANFICLINLSIINLMGGAFDYQICGH